MPKRMDWDKLMSVVRLGRENDPPPGDVRSEFQRDFDRIVYSSAFRRLQDKTQVFPLAESDYVRTRLTHSIEVSCVGRSLGTLAGAFIRKREAGTLPAAAEFGNVVAAACLAHDIGNPPFGHSGEDAIRGWFLDAGQPNLKGLRPQEKMDFKAFEGNAQGFRLLTRLENPSNDGGLQLTHATLAVFSKYPRLSAVSGLRESKKISEKKFGFFSDDLGQFSRVARGVGLARKSNGTWSRHPLTFLMEAADDICYRIIDLEDGCRLGKVSFDRAESLLCAIAFPNGGQAKDSGYQKINDPKQKIEYLRAKSISSMIYAVVEVFESNYDDIMMGKFEKELLGECAYAAQADAIKAVSRVNIYGAAEVVQIEAAGFEVMHGLLDKVVPPLLKTPKKRSFSEKKVLELIPSQFTKAKSKYEALLAATDYVSGMTDSFAVTLFKRLKGIELPRG
jgi:dGTPase